MSYLRKQSEGSQPRSVNSQYMNVSHVSVSPPDSEELNPLNGDPFARLLDDILRSRKEVSDADFNTAINAVFDMSTQIDRVSRNKGVFKEVVAAIVHSIQELDEVEPSFGITAKDILQANDLNVEPSVQKELLENLHLSSDAGSETPDTQNQLQAGLRRFALLNEDEQESLNPDLPS